MCKTVVDTVARILNKTATQAIHACLPARHDKRNKNSLTLSLTALTRSHRRFNQLLFLLSSNLIRFVSFPFSLQHRVCLLLRAFDSIFCSIHSFYFAALKLNYRIRHRIQYTLFLYIQ